MLSRLALFVARLTLTAWIGAAVLFVVVGVNEVTSPELSSEIKDRLVVLRFPAFYAAGFGLVGLAWLAVLVPQPPGFGTVRRWLCIALLTLAGLGMIGDYVWIYQPLESMVTPPGKPRTQEFIHLHEWSARVNGVNLMLCLLAAGLLNWPRQVGNSGVSQTT